MQLFTEMFARTLQNSRIMREKGGGGEGGGGRGFTVSNENIAQLHA